VSDSTHIREISKGFSILYAEDNNALRQQAGSLLKKLFDVVYVAADGEEALTLFKQYHPKIVITDIKMPRLDGMQLSVKIKEIRPETRIIIMSAFDDKEYLFEAIDIGIFRFIKKPVSVSSLTSVLLEVIENINKEEQSRIFFTHLNDVFNYQSSLIVMMKESKMILASQRFLDFFGVNSIEDFSDNRADLGSCFLKHDGFLYNDGSRDWLSVISANEDKLFHVKMTDNAHKMHHFIFKMHRIPEKPDMSILSFDDISELNLLGLFDNKKSVKRVLKPTKKRSLISLKSSNVTMPKSNFITFIGVLVLPMMLLSPILKTVSCSLRPTFYSKKRYRSINVRSSLPKPFLMIFCVKFSLKIILIIRV